VGAPLVSTGLTCRGRASGRIAIAAWSRLRIHSCAREATSYLCKARATTSLAIRHVEASAPPPFWITHCDRLTAGQHEVAASRRARNQFNQRGASRFNAPPSRHCRVTTGLLLSVHARPATGVRTSRARRIEQASGQLRAQLRAIDAAFPERCDVWLGHAALVTCSHSRPSGVSRQALVPSSSASKRFRDAAVEQAAGTRLPHFRKLIHSNESPSEIGNHALAPQRSSQNRGRHAWR
jgi:hypothetical protein